MSNIITPVDFPLDMAKFPNQFPLEDFKALVVGITGLAGSGKDTFARFLAEAIYGRIPLPDILSSDHYARPIKEAYVAKWGKVLNFTYEDTNDFEWKKQVNPFTNTTHREELQFDGTEGTRIRTGNPNTWVQHLWARNQSKSGFLLIPDTRFDNEKDFTHLNGILIKVRRQGQEVIATSNHSSENIPNDECCHFIVDNDGTLGDLQEKARNIAHTLIEHRNLDNTLRGFHYLTDEIWAKYKDNLLSEMAEKRDYVKNITELQLVTISTNP